MTKNYCVYLAFLLAWCALPQSAHAGPVNDNLPKIVHGGKLYDNWLAFVPKPAREKLEKVEQTHPSYPKNGKEKGSATWRCKECHGWDYRGNQGAYASGSHATGIRGIQNFAGKDPETVVKILRDDRHKIDETMINSEDAKALAAFVVAGQFDATPYLEPSTHKALGNAKKGATFFQTVCAVCHGLDGRWINFGSKEEVEYLGHVARENPWEFLHKIRNGQPARLMVSMRGLTIQQQIDILTYAQTLPLDPIKHNAARAHYDPALADKE